MLKKEEVEHIAHLARLDLSTEEIEALRFQLSAILESFNEIAVIDTTGVEPLVTPTEISVQLREDETSRFGETEELLENAAEKSGRLFKVPPVV